MTETAPRKSEEQGAAAPVTTAAARVKCPASRLRTLAGRIRGSFIDSVGAIVALDRYALLPDDSDVTVDTDGNTVTLSGRVRTWAEHDAVVDAAWRAIGVYDVLDNLSVVG